MRNVTLWGKLRRSLIRRKYDRPTQNDTRVDQVNEPESVSLVHWFYLAVWYSYDQSEILVILGTSNAIEKVKWKVILLRSHILSLSNGRRKSDEVPTYEMTQGNWNVHNVHRGEVCTCSWVGGNVRVVSSEHKEMAAAKHNIRTER